MNEVRLGNIAIRSNMASTCLVLVAERTLPALDCLHKGIWGPGHDTRFGANVQALSGAVLNGDVQVVGDEEVLPRSVVGARVEADELSAKVDAAYHAGLRIDSLNLSGTEIVVEVLIFGVRSRAAFSTVSKKTSTR